MSCVMDAVWFSKRWRCLQLLKMLDKIILILKMCTRRSDTRPILSCPVGLLRLFLSCWWLAVWVVACRTRVFLVRFTVINSLLTFLSRLIFLPCQQFFSLHTHMGGLAGVQLLSPGSCTHTTCPSTNQRQEESKTIVCSPSVEGGGVRSDFRPFLYLRPFSLKELL